LSVLFYKNCDAKLIFRTPKKNLFLKDFMETINHYTELIEKSLQMLGIEPETSRCADPGQWLVYNGETEIYIDLWEQKEPNGWNYFQPEGYNLKVFQVLSPVCFLPEESQLTAFYEDLLENNLNMFFASFIVNKQENMLALKFRRICNDLRVEDIIEAIESVGYYSELTASVFTDKYGVQRIKL
jgi:hypothetical protein